MGKNRYVGHRYIPIFENGWDKTRTYEPLTFVYYEGKTYVSRQLVPTNIEITNNDFWAFFMNNAPQIFTPTFMGEWIDTEYEPLSIVVNNGNTYVSKQDVPVGTLLTNETYWLDLSTYYNQLFTDYEIAEQERQSAELIRVENEKQRVLAYDNADMIGKVKLLNSFDNGDFSKGTKNWMTTAGYHNRFEVVDGIARNTETNPSQRSFIYNNSKVPSGHITYHAFRYKQTNIISSEIGLLYGLTNDKRQQIIKPTGEDFNIYTGMGVSTGDTTMRILISNIVSSGEYSFYLDYLLMLDLTSIFGAGNEPTKQVMDWIINNNGYFDELTLKRDDIQQYEINQLRKAVIALGGTI